VSIPCPAGFYCADPAGTPLACKAGTYCPAGNNTAELACPAGHLSSKGSGAASECWDPAIVAPRSVHPDAAAAGA